jgi:EAL domain-containing protein (putative c-di-GMP-specific phosphodiesterase class I)
VSVCDRAIRMTATFVRFGSARRTIQAVDSIASLVDDTTIDEIIEGGLVRSLYQPIVDLDSRRVVAYEALARGPIGSSLETPDRLFATAAERGLTSELDWACRAAAIQGALDAGLGRPHRLFVNVEPSTFRSPRPKSLDALVTRATSLLDIVIEVTERSLVDDPAALVAEVMAMRELGLGVALDDVGAAPASLALLPFLEPDVIKLDLALVQDLTDEAIASISTAVRADAERRGAVILAEGIETEEHVARALVLGARLGQGWLFGRPGPLPASLDDDARWPLPVVSTSRPVPVSPWSLVADWPDRRTTTKRLLMPMSRHIETRAVAGESCVLLSAFQQARHFTPTTTLRYERIAPHLSLVGALGVGMVQNPARGVRGGWIHPENPLAGEWTVTVVGPHDAVALIARDTGIGDSDSTRIFEYVITHHRPTVVAAARSLIQHIAPDS